MDNLFFLVSKVTAPFLRLETWIFLLLVAGVLLLLAGRVRLATRVLVPGVTLFAVIGVLPLGLPPLNWLEARYTPNPEVSEVAGIIVLGGGEDTDRSLDWAQPLVNEAGDRFIAALALARRHPDARVLFTGGIGSLDQSGPSGADVAEHLFRDVGLEPDRLLFERDSRNTAENARLSLALRGEAAGAWILVTSAFHMPRAVDAFCAAGWTDILPWPTDFRGQPFVEGIGWDPTGHLQDLATALREVFGLATYRTFNLAAEPNGCLYAG